MVGTAGLLRQAEIPGNGAPLALGADAPVATGPGVGPVVDVAAVEEAVVLAVGGDDLAQALGFLHGRTHHVLALDAPAVVGEARHIGGHGGQIRQGLALLAPGDGPVGGDVDHRVPPDQLQLLGQSLPAVGDGVQVGHGADLGEAPPGGGTGTGADGLLIRKSRLSQMNMYINETGKNGGVMKVNDLGGNGGLQGVGNGNNTALTDQDLRGTKGTARKQHGILQQILHDSSSYSGPQATQCIPLS